MREIREARSEGEAGSAGVDTPFADEGTSTLDAGLSDDLAIVSDAQAVQPRALVPSLRERALGIRSEDHVFTSLDPEEQEQRKSPLGTRARAFLSRINPRNVDGPLTPVVVFVLLAMLTNLDELVYQIALPEMGADFAENVAPIIALGTVIGTLRALLAPFFGFVTDRVNRVRIMRFSIIGGQLATMSTAFAGTFYQMLYGRSLNEFLTSPAGGTGTTAQGTLLADYYKPAALARVTLLISALATLAGLGGPLLAGYLIATYGWRQALFVLAISATVAASSTFLLKEPVRGAQGRPELLDARRVRRAEKSASSAATRRRDRVDADGRGTRKTAKQASRAERDKARQTAVPLREAFRQCLAVPTLRRLWMAAPFVIIGNGGIYVFLGFFWAEHYGLNAAQRGAIVTIFGVVQFFGPLLFTPVFERMMERRPGDILRTVGLLMVAQCVFITLLVRAPTLPLSIVAGLGFHAIWNSVTRPAQDIISLQVIPARVRGTGTQIVRWAELPGSLFFSYLLTRGGVGGDPDVAMFYVPFLFIAGVLVVRAGSTVAPDIRRARTADMAEQVAKHSQPGGSSKLLVCRGVEVGFDGTQVLFGVDLDIDEGEIVALVGTNGAGKSTVLRAIAGLHAASNGAIFFDGRDITFDPPHFNARRGIVMMPGGHATFPTLTVEENLRSATWMTRDDETASAARVEEVLSFFPVLRDRLGQQAGNLSGGEQQMVALGQAFIMQPRLLMIDELSLGLAPAVVEELLDILRRIHEQGTTVVLVEQSLNVALTIADRAVFMEKGQISFDGPTEELLGRSDLVRSVFMGRATTSARVSSPRSRADHATEGRLRLSAQGIAVAFGGVQALRGVDLHVDEGEVLGIIGPNGAGKTTLFDVISGFVRPDDGEVVLGSVPLASLPPDARAREGLGRSFQNVRLFPALTVRENIAVALERRAVKSKALAAVWAPQVRQSEQRIRRRAEGLIEILGLEAFADKFAGELSTGSRRAVEVACVMAAEPKFLLLDEPSSGLAQAETEELPPVLHRIVKETGCGLLVIEHDMPLITAVSDRLVAMELGEVISTGTPEEVCTDARVVSSYLSASESVIARSGRLAQVSAGIAASASSAIDEPVSTRKVKPE